MSHFNNLFYAKIDRKKQIGKSEAYYSALPALGGQVQPSGSPVGSPRAAKVRNG
jgi:hypothetical protein